MEQDGLEGWGVGHKYKVNTERETLTLTPISKFLLLNTQVCINLQFYAGSMAGLKKQNKKDEEKEERTRFMLYHNTSVLSAVSFTLHHSEYFCDTDYSIFTMHSYT